MNVTTRNSREPALVGNTLERRIGRLFSDVFGDLDWQYRDSAGASWVPPVDILEQPDAIRIMAEVPGVKPENVKISLENNFLTIHGSKEQIAEERTRGCIDTNGPTGRSSGASRSPRRSTPPPSRRRTSTAC